MKTKLLVVLCLVLLLLASVTLMASCNDDIRGLSYTLKEDGTYAVDVGWAKYMPSLEIPEAYEGKPVTEVVSTGGKAEYSLLKEVIIPNSVTVIDPDAFEGCPIEKATVPTVAIPAITKKALTTVVITGGAAIEERAFIGCLNLTSITVSESVTSVGERAFGSGTVETANVPSWAIDAISGDKLKTLVINGGERIPKYAFDGMNALTSVTVGSSVNEIDDLAFMDCSAKVIITVSSDNPAFKAVDNVLYTKDGTRLVKYFPVKSDASFTVPDGVRVIGGSAFYGCDDLVSVTLPDGLTSIGEYTFYGCKALASVTVPSSVTNIGDNTFSYCLALESITVDENNTAYRSVDGVLYTKDGKKLLRYPSGNTDTSYTVPYGVEVITANAFENSQHLDSLTVSGSVKHIYARAFYNCKRLADLTINAGSINIDSAAFYGCPITTATIPTGALSDLLYDPQFDKQHLTTVVINGGTVIDDFAFKGCYNLSSVAVGNSVTSIGDSAFSECSRLKNVSLGNRLRSIGDHAFYNVKFETLTIPESVTYIGDYAFYGSEAKSLTLGSNVTSIGEYAFYGCGITSISLPDSISSIGGFAFSSCKDLKSMTVGDGVTSISMGSGVFDDSPVETAILPACAIGLIPEDSIKTVVITGGSSISGGNTFRDCYKLTSVTLPDGITSIGDNAFYCCLLLESISLPDGVLSIGEKAFYGCGSLKSISLPDTVTSIGQYAFYECGKLESITIPDGVTVIDHYTFKYCTSLKSAVLGKGVTFIRNEAFYRCIALESVVIGEMVTDIGFGAFSECENIRSIKYRGKHGKWGAINKANPWISHADYYVTYEYTGE